MKRKFNYTGRKKIERGRVIINPIRENDSVVGFIHNKLDLNDMNLPSDGLIYAEAYYRTELKRFYVGTVARIEHSNFSLVDMAYTENLHFRILVVDPSDNKILAHADGISPDSPSERKPILPVEFRDLSNEAWRVTFDGEEDSPILLINKKIPNIEYLARNDPHFFVYVFPAVIREILTHMIFIQKIDSVDDPSVDWHADWLRFVRNIGVETVEILEEENIKNNIKEAIKWVDKVVEQFCNNYHMKFNEYIEKLEEKS